MKIIILDTNFLLHCIEFKIDFIRELERICPFSYQLTIVDKTIDELLKLKKPLAIALTKGMKQLPSSEPTVDEEIIKRATENIIIATQDKRLKKAIKTKGAGIIIIKQKKYLSLENQNLY